jgi:hypothetical protein
MRKNSSESLFAVICFSRRKIVFHKYFTYPSEKTVYKCPQYTELCKNTAFYLPFLPTYL